MVVNIGIAQRLKCCFLWESVNTMPLVLFTMEACYTIKEKKITDKNCFAVASHHFASVNYHFAGEIWEKDMSINMRQFLSILQTLELMLNVDQLFSSNFQDGDKLCANHK